MKYTKPEISARGSALGAIQSSQPKPLGNMWDAPVQNYTATSNAYEADE
jgi:hypothetical protein